MADVIIVVDFSSLKIIEVTELTGLIPLVKVPTRGKNILDMLMGPANTEFQVMVIASAVRSDHKAILAPVGTPPRYRTKRQTSRTFGRRTPRQHAAICYRRSQHSMRQIAPLMGSQTGISSTTPPHHGWTCTIPRERFPSPPGTPTLLLWRLSASSAEEMLLCGKIRSSLLQLSPQESAAS